MKKENQTIQYNIGARQACEDEDNIWLALNKGNLLCRWEKKSNIIYKECFLPEVNRDRVWAYEGICKWNDYIVIAPAKSKPVISVYHVKKKDLQEIWLKEAKDVGDDDAKFMMCFPYGNYVYLIGFQYPAIVRLNMVSLEPEYLTNWVSQLDEHPQKSKRIYLAYGEVVGNIAILPLVEAPGILTLDLDTGDTQIVMIPSAAKGFNSVVYHKGEIWLVDSYEGRVILWEPDINITSEVWITEEEKGQAFLFLKGVAVHDQLLLVPLRAKHAYWISMESADVQRCEALETHIFENRKKLGLKRAGCFPIVQNADGICLDFDRDDCFYSYNVSNKKWVPIKKQCEKKVTSAIVCLKYKYVLMENEKMGLEEFLQDLMIMECPDMDPGEPKDIGETIYRNVKGDI